MKQRTIIHWSRAHLQKTLTWERRILVYGIQSLFRPMNRRSRILYSYHTLTRSSDLVIILRISTAFVSSGLPIYRKKIRETQYTSPTYGATDSATGSLALYTSIIRDLTRRSVRRWSWGRITQCLKSYIIETAQIYLLFDLSYRLIPCFRNII
jgi:hypothetical protein